MCRRAGHGVSPPSPAAFSADEVRRLLAVVPDTIAGRRDRAILLVLVLTGRRRAEVIGLRAGDLSLEGEIALYAARAASGAAGNFPNPRTKRSSERSPTPARSRR